MYKELFDPNFRKRIPKIAELISSLSSTDSVLNQLSQATKYVALTYYEVNGVEDLVTFSAAKDLNALLQVSV